MAVGGVLRVQGPPPPIELLRAAILSRLGNMTRLGQRVEPSAGLRQPKWVDVEPNMELHVHDYRVDPGSTVANAVSAIIERPLDHARPLWDCYQISGYTADEHAICMRVHHSIADGQGTLLLLGRLLDLSPDGGMTLTDAVTQALEAQKEDTTTAKAKSGADFFNVVARTTRARLEPAVANISEFVRTLPDTANSMAAFTPKPPPKPQGLTGKVHAGRTWVSGRVPLEDVKLAKRALDCTVNDIVLSGCAAGFRALLLSRGVELAPDRVVRAAVPVSLRDAGDLSSSNQVQMLPVALPVGQADPRKRVAAVKTVTTSAKRSMLPVISDAVWTFAEKATPSPLMTQMLTKSVETTDWLFETVITNVPGPPMPLYIAGDEVLSLVPLVPIASGSKLQIVISVLSYNGSLEVGITGDAVAASDITVLVAGIVDELKALADLS